jgi:hypothetical protein
MKFLGMVLLAGISVAFLTGGVLMLGAYWANRALIEMHEQNMGEWRHIARLGLAFTSISLGAVFGGAFLRVSIR